MVRQINQPPPSDYPSPPGGNLGGLAKHIFDLAIPDVELWDNDIISPTGSYEVEISEDECNKVTKIYFVRRGLFNMNNTIKSLISTFVWRNPVCNYRTKKKSPRPELEPYREPVEPPTDICNSGVFVRYIQKLDFFENLSNAGAISEDKYEEEIEEIFYPSEGTHLIRGWVLADLQVRIKAKIHLRRTTSWLKVVHNFRGNIKPYQDGGWDIPGNYSEDDAIWEWKHESIYILYGNSQIGTFERIFPSVNPNISSTFYDFASAIPYFASLEHIKTILGENYRTIQQGYDETIFINELVVAWQSACPIFIPLLPEDCCKDMSCCPKNDNSDLLKLILKRLNTLSEKVGVEDYPVAAPTVLTDPSKGNISIANLTRLLSYSIKQLDALCGKYPIEIEIEDADLTQEGNQTKKIKLPNMAETLAEMMGILLILRTESDATLNTTIRTLIETGSTRQTAIGTYDLAQANAEFLGYKLTQIQREIPFTFSPGEEQLEKILKEKKVKVIGYENDDKEDLNNKLIPLLELAAMWKAQNFRNLGASNPLAKLTELFGSAQNLPNALANIKDVLEKETSMEFPEPKPDEPLSTEAFDDFIEQAEQGFIAQPGITDTIKPYGRKNERRPKIREIGKDTSDTEENP